MFNYPAFLKLVAQKKLKQVDVASYLGLSRASVNRWFKGLGAPSVENTFALAELLDVPIEDLYGDEKDQAQNLVDARPASSQRFINAIIDIPVFCDASVCCGEGFDLSYATPSPAPDFYVPAEKSKLGPLDPERPPYALRTDGDSMQGAGIPSGSYVIINPTLPAVGRFPAHVRYLGRDMIRFIEYRDGLPVALHSSNREIYPSIAVTQEEDESQGLFIFGRVVMVIKTEEINPAY